MATEVCEADLKKWACCGTPPSRGRNIKNPVEMRCEVCRRRTYVTRGTVEFARQRAAAIGKEIIVVCFHCAKHWVRHGAKGTGAVVYGNGPLVAEDVGMMVKELRDERLHAN